MMDLSEKGSGSQDMKKCCVDCKTTKTPLWRGGPAGPKTLCNACGIKHRKRRRGGGQVSNREGSEEKQKKEIRSSTKEIKNDNSSSNKLDVSLKLRLMTLGRQVLLRRSNMEKQRRLGLCEEEQAAVLLMALSSGSVYG
ncbi:hypothetical protein IFM89_033395 [Coptis chinensis]|uniref:GATA-type domain-containing protein n=1 Tax=Coptis chinensis TaxID=261450 RepID=A0A835HZF1_9MAGN|nr:hypothetical protein IFM89_033395 [Coptis chinensis]